MRAKLGQWLHNLALSAVSLLLCFLVLEFVVFRFIAVPDDVLPNVSINGVVRYLPGTKATFRHPDARATRVTINAEGWNSTKPGYALRKPDGTTRIAVIGDSYVHGAFVDVEDGFPEVMERRLKAAGRPVEVLRFGMDGAPLSQYLHMLRREVLAYKPDVVVIPLIHNDFDESYRFLRTRTGSSFMKLERDGLGGVREVAPVDFRPGAADVLRNSAAFRYLYYETNAYLTFKRLISRIYWGGSEDWAPQFVQSAVDIRKIADHESNRFFARYVMGEMHALARQGGFKLVFVMDGVREAVYTAKPVETFEVGKLNQIAAQVTGELGLPFLDLQEVFAADWNTHHQRFEYSYDWHWNVRGNALVGNAIAQFLMQQGVLGRSVLSKVPAGVPGPTGDDKGSLD